MTACNDTIAAIATPPGTGGVAVLRISGPMALPLLRRLFRPAVARPTDKTTCPPQPLPQTTPSDISLAAFCNSDTPLHQAGTPLHQAGTPLHQADTPGESFSFIPRHLHFGLVLDCDGEELDQALVVYMPGPASFTGEDVAEIHCHGGRGISTALLESVCCAGARLAAPGEFTRRALLNGRLDLTQAEAVAEIIHAPTREGARLAKAKLEGALGRRIAALRSAMDSMRAWVTMAVDFDEEEDIRLATQEGFGSTLATAQRDIRALLAAFERARLWREGGLAVLAGRVNAGKSSLLNALIGRERAIVSSTPGTTRDYIEESLNLSGLPVRLVDTAGLRQSGDMIENEGIQRSRDLAAQADALLFVCDVNTQPLPEEIEFVRKQWPLAQQGRLLLVMNKIDAIHEGQEHDAQAKAQALLRLAGADNSALPVCPVYAVSAKKEAGLDALTQGIRTVLLDGRSEEGGDIAPNIRQSNLLRRSLAELDALSAAIDDDLPPDLLAVHLDAASLYLDEISGRADTEELLDSIFSSFCIGK